MTTLSVDERIQAANRLEALLKDPLVGAALIALDKRYYDEFLNSENSEERIRAWAKGNVLKDFSAALKAVLNDGKMAKDTKGKQDKPPAHT